MREPNAPAELHTTGGFAAEITRLSPRLCHATRDDISIAGFPPAGENDGVGDFCKNDEVRERRNNKQPSFSPLLFVIFAEGGNDEQ